MRTLIVNNPASQGYILNEKIEDSFLISSYNPVSFYPKEYGLIPSNKLLKPFYFLYNALKYDRIIINIPTMWWVLIFIPFLKKKEVIYYYHGSDIRNNTIRTKISKLFWNNVEIWYSTSDLKKLLPNKATHKPAEIIRYNYKKKVLIFSRNDSFKKTHLYFNEIRNNPDKDYYFIDWFKGKEYEKWFKKNMPENSYLISKIPKDLVHFVLNGFDEVKGQRSGEKGVSEMEIEVYRNGKKNL